jgi:hypothetical protein
MTKKLEGNGLWEASRMMLPQHREAFVSRQEALDSPRMPQIHEEEFELIVRHLKESWYTQKLIVVEWFHEHKREHSTGAVQHIDEHQQRIQLKTDAFSCWITLQQIIDVRND